MLVDGANLVLRPSFEALVAAKEELGPLFEVVDRAASGKLKIGEVAGLLYHCVAERPADCTREKIGKAVVEAGLARVAPVLKVLLGQILRGR